MQNAEKSDSTDGNWLTPRWRTACYALVLAISSSLVLFHDLGADSMGGDEALYALAADNLHANGEWFHVTPYPPTPYFQKPPLYIWLTNLTYDAIDGYARYRAWSAGFGVGCIVLTCVLGAMLLGPEAGLLAGLIFLTNKQFLLVHGPRTGAFDVGVTLLFLAALLAYWLTLQGRLRWAGWLIIGLCCGLACLFKPFGGLPMLGFIVVHALVLAPELRSRKSSDFAGMGVALAACVVVGAPWYLIQWHLYPGVFWKEIFYSNVIERASVGIDPRHVQSWWYYFAQITSSSEFFKLFGPAVVLGIIACFWGDHKREFRFLMWMGLGWVVAFSLSRSKILHYTYPAFGLITIVIAELVLAALRWVTSWLKQPVRRHIFEIGWKVIAAVLLFRCAQLIYVVFPTERRPYPPLTLYQTFEPAIATGQMRVIEFGLHDDAGRPTNIDARDDFHLKQMKHVTRVSDVTQLQTLLTQHQPTLLLLTRSVDRSTIDALSLPERRDDRLSYEANTYSAWPIDINPLLDIRVPAGATNDYVMLSRVTNIPGGYAFTDEFGVQITPAVRSDAWLTIRFQSVRTSQPIHWTMQLGTRTIGDMVLPSVPSGQDLTLLIRQRRWVGDGPQNIVVRGSAGAGEPVIGAIEEVRITYVPTRAGGD